MLKLRKLALCVALSSLVCGPVLAGPYAFNARQDAMGGAGVSSANYLSAPFYNPALLALSDDSDQVGLLLPVVGAAVRPDDVGELARGAAGFRTWRASVHRISLSPISTGGPLASTGRGSR